MHLISCCSAAHGQFFYLMFIHLDVKLKDCGTELVEVSDNGQGVKEQYFEGLSKLTSELG